MVVLTSLCPRSSWIVRMFLGGGADLLLDRQMGQEGVDFRLGHLGGVAHVVEMNVAPDPMTIGLLRPPAVMARTHGLAKPVEQLRSADRGDGSRWALVEVLSKNSGDCSRHSRSPWGKSREAYRKALSCRKRKNEAPEVS